MPSVLGEKLLTWESSQSKQKMGWYIHIIIPLTYFVLPSVIVVTVVILLNLNKLNPLSLAGITTMYALLVAVLLIRWTQSIKLMNKLLWPPHEVILTDLQK